MRRMLATALFAPLMATAAAANDDPPGRKPGLWEVAIERGAKIQTMQACVDAASEQAALVKGKQSLAEICSRFESHLDGNTYTQDTVCRLMGSVQTSRTVMTIVSDEARETVIASRYDPPMMGKETSQTKQTSRWLGPCGPDMKPGQIKVNGMIISGPAM